ncbi:MAG: helix-turn-helix domain-containing protein [Clostridia bacterium]|nr:helix-turn-helix domain-containing protein [Clostridia bacterium]MBR0415504.1 helix-turn-helix domain-containing protein [Clostridia bacterium]
MSDSFAKMLRKIRTDKGLSQRELADKIYVTRSAITHWENGSRMPDADTIARLCQFLDVNLDFLLGNDIIAGEGINVIVVDDEKIALGGALSVLDEVLPNASVIGFTHPSKAIEYAKNNKVALAFLDIELGNTSGLELCSTLLEINPRTNVVFVTAYSNYSLHAWGTRAVGFILKPITAGSVSEMVKRLRYPLKGVIE